jgi:hypothetical protein
VTYTEDGVLTWTLEYTSSAGGPCSITDYIFKSHSGHNNCAEHSKSNQPVRSGNSVYIAQCWYFLIGDGGWKDSLNSYSYGSLQIFCYYNKQCLTIHFHNIYHYAS